MKRESSLRVMRAVMDGWATAATVQRMACWRSGAVRAKAEKQAAAANANAMSDAARADKTALEAAEAEVARIQHMLKDAGADEAAKLMLQLRTAEQEAADANKAMAEKIMCFVGKGWRNDVVIRAMTNWKVLMAIETALLAPQAALAAVHAELQTAEAAAAERVVVFAAAEAEMASLWQTAVVGYDDSILKMAELQSSVKSTGVENAGLKNQLQRGAELTQQRNVVSEARKQVEKLQGQNALLRTQLEQREANQNKELVQHQNLTSFYWPNEHPEGLTTQRAKLQKQLEEV